MRTRQKRSIDVSPQASAAVDRPSLKLRKLGALLVTADTVLALTGLDRPIQTALTAGSPGGARGDRRLLCVLGVAVPGAVGDLAACRHPVTDRLRMVADPGGSRARRACACRLCSTPMPLRGLSSGCLTFFQLSQCCIAFHRCLQDANELPKALRLDLGGVAG